MGELAFLSSDGSFEISDLDEILERVPEVHSLDATVHVFRCDPAGQRLYLPAGAKCLAEIYSLERMIPIALDKYFLELQVNGFTGKNLWLDKPIAEVLMQAPLDFYVDFEGRIDMRIADDTLLSPACQHYAFVLNSQILAQHKRLEQITGHAAEFRILWEGVVGNVLDMDSIRRTTEPEESRLCWSSNPYQTQLLGHGAPFPIIR